LVDQSQGYYFGVVPSMAFCNSGEFIVAKLGNFFCNFVRFYFAINMDSVNDLDFFFDFDCTRHKKEQPEGCS